MYYRCNINLATSFVHLILKHFTNDHEHISNVIYRCPILNCLKVYKSVRSVGNHITLKHKIRVGLGQEGEKIINPSDSESVEILNSPGPGDNNIDISDNINIENLKDNQFSQYIGDKQLKLFLLDLKVKQYVSEKACESIIHFFGKFI